MASEPDWDTVMEMEAESRIDAGVYGHVFLDPVSGRSCELVIPPGGNIFAAPGKPKTGVRHPGCDAVADLCMDLDAFWCPACKMNGRISGAWAADLIGGTSGGEDDFVQDRHADLDPNADEADDD